MAQVEIGGPMFNYLEQLDDIELHLKCKTLLSSLHAYFYHVKV